MIFSREFQYDRKVAKGLVKVYAVYLPENFEAWKCTQFIERKSRLQRRRGGRGDTWVDARGFLAHEQWEAYQLLKSWKARDAWRLLTSWLTSVASALNSVAPKNTIWHLGYSGNFAIKICVFPVFVGAIITSGFTRLRGIFLDLYSWEQHPSFERKLKMKTPLFSFFIKLPMRIVRVALSRVSLINTLVFFPRPEKVLDVVAAGRKRRRNHSFTWKGISLIHFHIVFNI